VLSDGYILALTCGVVIAYRSTFTFSVLKQQRYNQKVVEIAGACITGIRQLIVIEIHVHFLEEWLLNFSVSRIYIKSMW
jgi:hypothetical protein